MNTVDQSNRSQAAEAWAHWDMRIVAREQLSAQYWEMRDAAERGAGPQELKFHKELVRIRQLML
ncbi:hypothetical protein [Caballeronia sp. ATUFL_M2_KS44]|uniref:hypothetical protein n=1 Tax=Caballeronia sp. ATUFL_M2_KS44 TaxID=2921767 RepID=UPI0020288B6A|nr:hypothetical protein [Caballeronia sp. ATUFL_M2_KS44]